MYLGPLVQRCTERTSVISDDVVSLIENQNGLEGASPCSPIRAIEEWEIYAMWNGKGCLICGPNAASGGSATRRSDGKCGSSASNRGQRYGSPSRSVSRWKSCGSGTRHCWDVIYRRGASAIVLYTARLLERKWFSPPCCEAVSEHIVSCRHERVHDTSTLGAQGVRSLCHTRSRLPARCV